MQIAGFSISEPSLSRNISLALCAPVLALSGWIMFGLFAEYSQARVASRTAVLTEHIGETIGALQKERGLSSSVIASGFSAGVQALSDQRAIADGKMQALATLLKDNAFQYDATVRLPDGLAEINQVRTRVDSKMFGTQGAAEAYAEVVNALLDATNSLAN